MRVLYSTQQHQNEQDQHHITIQQQHGFTLFVTMRVRYCRSQLISDYLNDSKIKLVFLPPYALNLNLIERYWKFFKKKILYGRYYETFSLFYN
jgi:hypothetical protein